MSRREALKKGAIIGGTVLWVTPVVQTIGMTHAFAQTPSGTPGPPGPNNTPGTTTDGGTTPHGTPGTPGIGDGTPHGPSGPEGSSGSNGSIGAQVHTVSAAQSGSSFLSLAKSGINAEHAAELGLSATALGVALTAASRLKAGKDDESEELG